MNGNGRNQPGGGTWRYRASTQEGKKQYVWVGDLGGQHAWHMSDEHKGETLL